MTTAPTLVLGDLSVGDHLPEWEALAETYTEGMARWDKRAKAPYFEVLEALRRTPE